jgi:hypothetical protein
VLIVQVCELSSVSDRSYIYGEICNTGANYQAGLPFETIFKFAWRLEEKVFCVG